jgi:hypothetical protein
VADTYEEVVLENLEHHLSFNALKGSQGLGTLRFQGSVQGVTLQILLDSGSSDNFLQPRIAHFLKLPIQPAENFKVLVGNGHSLTAGYISDFQVQIQDHTLQLPVYLLPVTGADFALGAPWLATLGPHIADFSALTLKFYLGNKFITLTGDKPGMPQQAQYHHIKRLNSTHAIDEMFSLQILPLSTAPALENSATFHCPELKTILDEFQDVFATPSGYRHRGFKTIPFR